MMAEVSEFIDFFSNPQELKGYSPIACLISAAFLANSKGSFFPASPVTPQQIALINYALLPELKR